MLIIKEPIRLKCRKAIETVNNSFNHRIMDNYQLMTVDYKEGEFLHLVTSPPEVYLAGQEMSSLVNSTVIYNNKELKLEMINNLLNRMSMTEQISLSYQDKIYIDTMLRKLGIKNTASFISHVMQQKAVNQKLEQQIEEFWQLLTNENINENYREEIIMQMQNRREEKREEHINYLYESIMNRLNTGVIYRIMENFNHASNFELSTMNHHQMVLSEQKKVSHQIFLNQLENYFSEQEIPFVYLEQNSYENVENLEESHNKQWIDGRLTQAILHRLLNSIHMERLSRYKNEEKMWIDLKDSLYMTAENTLFRMENQVYKTFESRIENQYFSVSSHGTEYLPGEGFDTKEAILYLPSDKPEDGEEEVTDLEPEGKEEVSQLYRQLEEVNKKNLENWEIYRQLLSENKETVQKNIKTVEERREESLKALHSPGELLLQYQREAGEQQEEEIKSRNQRSRLLPEETRKIFEVIEEYQQSDRNNATPGIVSNDLEGLARDTQLIHSEQKAIEERKEELLLREREETNRLLERWKQEKQKDISYQEVPYTQTKLSLVHKQVQQTLEEEVLQQLLQENKTVLKEQRNEQVLKKDHSRVTTVQHEEQRVNVQRNKKEITEMIDQGVRRQIGAISEQVYNRLEKKLSNEKKRRGF